MHIADICMRRVVHISPESSALAAARMRHAVRRPPVLDAAVGLAGLLSPDDVYGALSTHVREQAHERHTRNRLPLAAAES